MRDSKLPLWRGVQVEAGKYLAEYEKNLLTILMNMCRYKCER